MEKSDLSGGDYILGTGDWSVHTFTLVSFKTQQIDM